VLVKRFRDATHEQISALQSYKLRFQPDMLQLVVQLRTIYPLLRVAMLATMHMNVLSSLLMVTRDSAYPWCE
jgi:hypothetical protein